MTDISNFQKFIKSDTDTEKTSLFKDAWYYPRVSSKNQFENNKSIDNQNEVCYSYAKKNDIKITREFGGTYESAKGDFTRKEFMRLINEIKKSRKRPKYVLIYIMSRFSRTGGSAISLANMLVEDMGVHLIETSTGLSTETDFGKMAVYQKLIEARKETISRLDSTIPGMKSALKGGKWIGQVPKGYTKFGPYVTDEERFASRTRIEINQDGILLKEAWKWKRRGERDYIILKKLTEKGLELTLKKLYKIWRKPFYAGIIINSLIDEPIEGKWEALVSQEDFIYINEKLDEKKREKIGYEITKISDPRPLNGDLICSECGTKLTGYVRKKKVKSTGEIRHLHYYRCFGCYAVNVNANSTPKALSKGLHNQFEDLLKSFQINNKFLKPILKNLQMIVENRNKELKEDAKQNRKRTTELKKELETLEERFAFGKIPENIYEKFSKKLTNQIFELEQKINTDSFLGSNPSKKIKEVIEKINNLDKTWNAGNYEVKKTIQKLVFPLGMLVKAKNKQLQTSNVSRLLSLIGCFSAKLKGNKKGTENENIVQSLSAERGGFEPPVPSIQYVSLANWWIKPLSHLSVTN